MPTPHSSYREKDVFLSKGFRIRSKFLNIPKWNRLHFLKTEVDKAKQGGLLPYERIRKMRQGFDKNKFDHLPMESDCPCYCCWGIARIRHHVVPLGNGGGNNRNNIVPLCDSCHLKIHPDMKNKAKRPEQIQQIAIMGIPIVAVVVVPSPQ